MKILLLFYSVAYFLFVAVISVIVKRSFNINYDRKILVSATLLVISVLVAFSFMDVPMDPSVAVSQVDKILWTIVIVLLFNAIIQFILWAVFIFFKNYRILRIPRFTFNILSLILIIVVSLYTVKYLFSINLTGFLVTSTVVSAIVGLSLQDTLNNLFAGISLQIESPYNVDDWVNLAGYEGKVVGQNWRTLTLLTRESHRIFIPNKSIAEEKIVNYSRPTPRQIHSFFIEIDYSHPPNEVKRLIREVLNDLEEVQIDHIAFPYTVSYEASGIKYCIKYWIIDYLHVPRIQDIVLTRLWYKLKRHGIKIPYTIAEVHMEMVTPEIAEQDQKDEKEYIFKVLKQQSWLNNIEEGQLHKLSSIARLESFANGEKLVKEGDDGDSLFIISKGVTNIVVDGMQESQVNVAIKEEGDFFGEMSLLTGEPRSATVFANEDVEVLIIDKKAFSQFLVNDTSILEELVSALESNQSNLSKIIEEERKKLNVSAQSVRQAIFDKILTYLDPHRNR